MLSAILKYKSRIILLISGVIFVGMLLIVTINFSSYSEIIKEDILNISKLTSTSIYSKINNELTKPIFVALTMANDSFVKNWFTYESDAEIIEYLEGIRKKYNYNSTFLVSADTLNYYHYNGLFKRINPSDAHDVWFYDFIDTDQKYALDIDQDEVDNHLLTIFVNCKIFDKDEGLLGVTGVGVKVDYVQKILEEFESSYNLEAFLIDSTGLVQVHTDSSQIESRNIFDEKLYNGLENKIINRSNLLNTFEMNAADDTGYIISCFIEDFDWYLVVKKDTSVLKQTFYSQMFVELIIFIIVTGVVVFIVISLILYNEKKILDLSMTDSLTGLYNRRGFDIRLKCLLDSSPETQFCVFLFDVDDFKRINDRFGHLQGDKVLKRIVDVFNAEIKECVFARWGGDEFSGVLYKDLHESTELMEALRIKVAADDLLKEFDVTLSIGIVEYSEIETDESLMRKADRAMYTAKSEGKNRLSY
ncbi:MAG TPA: sensor domain-containing diguanylate cyclase [Thermotogota bacterium]|nr:sensor domain-containing diguanylate cyclase [Thermotogota bacterium]HPJ88209.1 sensor domain-containing diguanylate cyclase [Thermotogota bacterium]HPR95642.1 sensor domain-containing diguanylate cyclase [Thermotogota bacterium]